MTDTVEIVNNKFIDDKTFHILRNEGWGYVQNFVEYDKNILNLETEYIPGNGEGAGCQVIYKFKIIKHQPVQSVQSVQTDQLVQTNPLVQTVQSDQSVQPINKSDKNITQIKFITDNDRYTYNEYYHVDLQNKKLKSVGSQIYNSKSESRCIIL